LAGNKSQSEGEQSQTQGNPCALACDQGALVGNKSQSEGEQSQTESNPCALAGNKSQNEGEQSLSENDQSQFGGTENDPRAGGAQVGGTFVLDSV
jgi:hypothetical protein